MAVLTALLAYSFFDLYADEETWWLHGIGQNSGLSFAVLATGPKDNPDVVKCYVSAKIDEYSTGDNKYSGDISIPATETVKYTYYGYDDDWNWVEKIIPLSCTVEGIYQGAFSYCDGLTSVTMPNTIKEIGKEAFKSCDGLTSVTIPNSVITIGEEAFGWCYNLKSLIIGTSVKEIGKGAFGGVYPDKYDRLINNGTWITDLTWNAINCPMLNRPTYSHNYFNNWYIGTRDIEHVAIGAGVEVLPTSFLYESLITELTVPESVSAIGENAFSKSTKISHITWNAVNCATNGDMYTKNIERVTIGPNVGILPANFAKDSQITELTIPESVNDCLGYAFSGCTKLTDLTWNAINCRWNGQMYTNNIEHVTIGPRVQLLPYGFAQDSKITEVSIPNSMTGIGTSAFKNCSGLTSIELPNSITSIGAEVFRGCTGLTSIDIPDQITELCENLFYGCTGLTSIEIPHGVTTIGSGTFSECTNLKSVTIPNTVTKIGTVAFTGTALAGVTIPNSVTTIGSYAFYGTPLRSIKIPQAVTSIGERAFYECTNLTTLYWNATNCHYDHYLIDPYELFRGCPNLNHIIIGENVEAIDNMLLGTGGYDEWYVDEEGHMLYVDTVTCHATTPPMINEGTFDNNTYKKALLIVPPESEQSYRMNDVWKKFFEREPEINPCDINGDGEVNIADVNALIDAILLAINNLNYDANGDGEVTLADVNLIIQSILNNYITIDERP